MRNTFVLGMLAAFLLGLVALAQSPLDTAKQPKYIWTQHVTIAEGKGMSYPGLLAQFRRAAETTKADTYWLAGSYLTGDMRQVVYVSFYNNFAGVETDLASFEKIAVETIKMNPNFMAESGATELAPHGTIAKYREDLSYLPDKVPGPQTKFWEVTTIMLKPGHMTDFADLVKTEIELLKKADLDEHFLVYQVMAGLPTSGSAFYIVKPMKSLAEMDADSSERMKSVFTPIVRRQFESQVAQMVSHIESNLLAVRPDLSRPPQTFLAANPDFWTVKEAAPVVARGKKVKKAAVEPAAVKEEKKP